MKLREKSNTSHRGTDRSWPKQLHCAGIFDSFRAGIWEKKNYKK